MNTDPWSRIAALAGSASAIIAAVAAGIAAAQIWFSRRDANRRASLEQLREVDLRLQPLLRTDPRSLQREVLACYASGGPSLSEECTQYLAFLNSIDLLAFAVQSDLVDEKLVNGHVRTLFSPHLINLTFLRELQTALHNPGIYENLATYLLSQRERK